MSFESQLSNFLSDCEKLIVLGVGNELKSDDGVGPFIINKLKEENIPGKLHRQNQKGKSDSHYHCRCMFDGL